MMAGCCDDLDLTVKALLKGGINQKAWVEDLEGDPAVHARVIRQKDGRHPAFP